MTTMSDDDFKSEEEAIDALTKLGGGHAVKSIETNWSDRNGAYLTMVWLYDEWGGGSCNATGVSRMQALTNAVKVTRILIASRKPPA